MDSTRDRWIARSAVAAATASRWLSGPSLALSALALCFLIFPPDLTAPVALALALAAAGGAVQAYIALRIEFDRRIFEEFAGSNAQPVDAAGGFDNAVQALGLLPPDKSGRSMVQRAEGLMSLVRRSGWIFLAQLALLIAARWMPG